MILRRRIYLSISIDSVAMLTPGTDDEYLLNVCGSPAARLMQRAGR